VLRVVHVITKLELGGAQENTLYTLGHLDPARFSGLLVAGRAGLLVEDARRAVREGRYEARFVPALVREIRPLCDAAALAALVRILRAELRSARARGGGGPAPVVVHTHSSKAGVLGRAAARLAGVPIVIHSIHGFAFHPRQRAAVRRLWVALERLAARWTTHFVAVAQADVEEGVALGLFPRERATLIRSGIEVARFAGGGLDRAAKRAELGVPADAPLAGMIGNFKPQKNPVDFVRLAARVAERVPAARFVLAGDGPLRGAVEAEARRLGIGGRLLLLGWRRDVDELIPCLDVLVLTSLWEGLPRVFPQAMAAGRPVVAYRVDGAPEAVEEGVTGFLVEPGDWEGAAARVAELLLDPVRAAALGSAGRARVGEFDAGEMVRRQEELYERLWRQLPARSSSRARAGMR
jgi:glycosyltransferase involved in cell wall biosynthesis